MPSPTTQPSVDLTLDPAHVANILNDAQTAGRDDQLGIGNPAQKQQLSTNAAFLRLLDKSDTKAESCAALHPVCRVDVSLSRSEEPKESYPSASHSLSENSEGEAAATSHGRNELTYLEDGPAVLGHGTDGQAEAAGDVATSIFDRSLVNAREDLTKDIPRFSQLTSVQVLDLKQAADAATAATTSHIPDDNHLVQPGPAILTMPVIDTCATVDAPPAESPPVAPERSQTPMCPRLTTDSSDATTAPAAAAVSMAPIVGPAAADAIAAAAMMLESPPLLSLSLPVTFDNVEVQCRSSAQTLQHETSPLSTPCPTRSLPAVTLTSCPASQVSCTQQTPATLPLSVRTPQHASLAATAECQITYSGDAFIDAVTETAVDPTAATVKAKGDAPTEETKNPQSIKPAEATTPQRRTLAQLLPSRKRRKKTSVQPPSTGCAISKSTYDAFWFAKGLLIHAKLLVCAFELLSICLSYMTMRLKYEYMIHAMTCTLKLAII
jgi:hypothetical protein